MTERRNIDELMALYELEDELRDIYVEGTSDKVFIGWLLESNGLNKSNIYSIEDINIEDDILDKHELPRGSNRSRVIAASLEIAGEHTNRKNVLFVADRDFEDYIPTKASSKSLVFTDYNSIESYFINDDSIKKILAIAYSDHTDQVPSFIEDCKTILRNIYSVRMANERLKWCMTWLDFKKYVKVKSPALEFELESFVEAYLKKNRKWSMRQEFNACMALCSSELNDDCRLSIRGHDFSMIMLHCLNKKYRRRKMDNVNLFEGFLLSSLDKDILMEESLMKTIHEFSISGPAT